MNFLKKNLIYFFPLLISIFWLYRPQSERKAYEKYLREHAYLNRNIENVSEEKAPDQPDEAWELNFLLTMDPQTKKPETKRLLETYQELKEKNKVRLSGPGQESSPWVERGPNNVGGRTRALLYDPNIANKVWAAGVSGGLWFNNDITDANSSWQSVDDFWDNLAVTCIAFDPNNSSIIYAGTGEGWQNLDATRGAGVWKSSDGGINWSQLTATSGFYFVNDLIVRDESDGANDGVLYVATSQSFNNGTYEGSNGIHFSSNGGTSFSSVSTFKPVDLGLGADNKIWAGTADGKVMSSNDGSNWTTSYNTGLSRVAIACAPSDANFVYALIADGSQVGTIIYTEDNGANWTAVNEPADADNDIDAGDFTRNQAWYDLVIAVDPNDANTVVVGGIDLFRSTDHGLNWSQISKWSNNNNLAGLNCALVHADQHAIDFKGAGSNEVLFGNDGGVFYASDLSNAANSDAISARNKNYNVTQFYACAIHPTAGEDFFLAGAQDNGSQRFDTSGMNATTIVNGGDGAFCFIDQTDPTFQITSYVRNVYDLSTNGGSTFYTNLQNDQSTGLFINPADYDDVQDILFSSRDENSINRISGVTSTPSVGSISISLGSTTTHLRVSPYTTASSTLFAGTMSGRLFKIENADSSSPSSTEITGSSFSTGSISCVEIGASEDELLVTFSNYGVTSVWYTSDGGSTWESKEGDLPDMPVRWALFNPNNKSEVILATELGVWRTSNISNASPAWVTSSSGLANVRVDMLQTRTSDHEVIAATHGRGLFSSNGFQEESVPTVDFHADRTFGCGSSLTVNFVNLSTAYPVATSYMWSFPGGSPSSSTSQTPPTIVYDTPGSYAVSLTVINSLGQTTETKSDYISLGTGVNLPFEEGFESSSSTVSCWLTARGANGLGTGYDWVLSNSSWNTGSTSAFSRYEDTGSSEMSQDWLISPQINLTENLQSTLSFYSRQVYSESYGSLFHVRVSTTSQTDISSFTNIQTFSESDFTTSFESYQVDLSAYDNQTIYIAFVHEQNYGDSWYLDDIRVTGTSIEIFSDNGFEFCSNDQSTLSTINDSNFSYQWKLNGTPITNATSYSYQPTESGNYSVAATFGNNTIESRTKTVTVLDVPVINTQPGEVVGCITKSINLSIEASGTNLSYQWQINGENLTDDGRITGSTSAALSIGSLTSSDAADYTCIIMNDNCSIISEIITLSISDLEITSQTTAVTGCLTEAIDLSVEASGTNLTYQWQIDGVDLNDDGRITGSTSAALSIGSLTSNDAADYTCTIMNDNCSIISEVITLSISDLPEITSQPSAVTGCLTEAVDLSIEASGTNLNFQWQIDGVDLNDDSRVTGTTTATLTISNLSANDAMAYTCLVMNDNCSIMSEAISLSVNELPQITSQPSNLDLSEGQTAAFNVTANGNALSYQWFLGDTPVMNNNRVSGSQSSSLTIANLMASDAGEYSCQIESECQIVLTTDVAALNVETVTAISSQLEKDLNIYPNPARDYLFIEIQEPQNKIIFQLYDISGQLVKTNRINLIHHTGRIDVAEVPKGIYFLNIQLKESLITKQIVIQ